MQTNIIKPIGEHGMYIDNGRISTPADICGISDLQCGVSQCPATTTWNNTDKLIYLRCRTSRRPISCQLTNLIKCLTDYSYEPTATITSTCILTTTGLNSTNCLTLQLLTDNSLLN